MYYTHTSLATLSQDDLYSILWLGGIAGGVLFVLMVLAIAFKYISGLDNHRGDSILGAVASTLIKIITTNVFWLFFIVFLYTVFMYGAAGSFGLNAAESLEWFLHTDWLGNTDNLIESIDKIKTYGDEAVTLAENTIISIYVTKILWLAALFFFALVVTFSIMMKINKIAQENKVNSFQYSATLGFGAFISVIVLVGTIHLINSAIDQTFYLSDKIDHTHISPYKASIHHIYLDALSPRALNSIITQRNENDF